MQGLAFRIISVLQRIPVGLDYSQWEFVLNILMFVPLGILLALLFGPKFFWLAIVGAIAVSLAIEGIQRFIPDRVPDERDLLANGIGGCLGMLVVFVGIEWSEHFKARAS